MLKTKNYQEAIIGLVMTIIVALLKDRLLKKNSTNEVLLVSGIGWALHYLVRKAIMNEVKEDIKIKL